LRQQDFDRSHAAHLATRAALGDAAHAMSPVGGIGINPAIQDAVAAASTLAMPLLDSRVSEEDLRQVQKRQALPTRLTQCFQLSIQNRVIKRILDRSTLASSTEKFELPLIFRLVRRFPV
jgi:2-polyprenyl-6-methoxyphenol hydroxylase-like FAD-dependent oxidoreductase